MKTVAEQAHLRQEVKAFLTTRRARLTPAEAGVVPGAAERWNKRRVPGLRREEVAALAGISLEYYIRCERGNLKGVSPEVLRGLATALKLSPVEQEHLQNLSRRAEYPVATSSMVQFDESVKPTMQAVVNTVTAVPAWVRNEYMDIIATNPLCEKLYRPIFEDLPDRPNTARHCFIGASAQEFWTDREHFSAEFAAKLRLEYARHPGDESLKKLIDELLSTPGPFRSYWASADVAAFNAGVKRFLHPTAGLLTFSYETMNLNSSPGYVLSIYMPSDEPTREKLGEL